MQLRRRRAEGAAAAKPALQLVVLSVNDGEILPGKWVLQVCCVV